MARRKRRRPPPASPPGEAWSTIYPTLDLHGETAESARRRAERWLRGEQADGVRTVRLITGRGMHSAGPPVLRGEIEELLRALRGTLVSGYAREPGGGAFRVELTRPAPRPAAPLRPLDRRLFDPDLRRRAEEALGELGVTPTPALLEAEMRRLLAEEEGGEGSQV